MLNRVVKHIAICLSAVVFFTNINIDVQASGVSSVLPSAGINAALTKGTTLESLQSNDNGEGIRLETMIELSAEENSQNQVKKEIVIPDEKLENVVVIQVKDYANVRSTPSDRGAVIGKIYDKAVGTICSQEKGWYEIKSGNVIGYVKDDFCVVGNDAKLLAAEYGTRMAKVLCDGLAVRSEADAGATILGMVAMGDELLVTGEINGWVRVDVEEGFGWIAEDYVNVYTDYIRAESTEEEQKRLEKEQKERDKARIAAAKSVISTVEETDENAMGIAVAEYAVQFIGNPYVWGGTSLTEGADCSGFVLKVYEKFGVELPHSSASDRQQGYAVDGLENAQPGDLICYSGHVALYIGDGQIVHAASEKSGIKVSEADYRQILAIRRIF